MRNIIVIACLGALASIAFIPTSEVEATESMPAAIVENLPMLHSMGIFPETMGWVELDTDYSGDLQSAIEDLPSDGGLILVEPDTTFTFSDAIRIQYYGVVILGSGHSSVLKWTSNTDGIYVQPNSVSETYSRRHVICNLTMEADTTTNTPDTAIDISGPLSDARSTDVHISNVHFKDWTNAVGLHYAWKSTITNCYIEGCSSSGILAYENGSDQTIRDNTIVDCDKWGVEVSDTQNCLVVQNNYIARCEDGGIRVNDGESIFICSNRIEDCGPATGTNDSNLIEIGNPGEPKSVTIQNNFLDAEGSSTVNDSQIGINIQSGQGVSIFANKINGCDAYGLYVDSDVEQLWVGPQYYSGNYTAATVLTTDTLFYQPNGTLVTPTLIPAGGGGTTKTVGNSGNPFLEVCTKKLVLYNSSASAYVEVLTYNGDPDGNLEAYAGSLCFDVSASKALYRNTSQGTTGTTWTQITIP